jgi:hypothetical protein
MSSVTVVSDRLVIPESDHPHPHPPPSMGRKLVGFTTIFPFPGGRGKKGGGSRPLVLHGSQSPIVALRHASQFFKAFLGHHTRPSLFRRDREHIGSFPARTATGLQGRQVRGKLFFRLRSGEVADDASAGTPGPVTSHDGCGRALGPIG